MKDRARVPAVQPSERLRELVDSLEVLAERRLAAEPASVAALGRATRFRDHLAGHVHVRARSLDAPLVVLVLGPTGAGKSTLFNTIVGRAASPTGVLRPTTRTAIVLAHPDDEAALREGTLAGIEGHRIRLLTGDDVPAGVALIDAPDIDSVEHANRELADRLVEAADLCIFVTTATRYADRVPWVVLERVRDRGLPLLVVVNRLPTDESDRREVLDDVERLFVEAGLAGGRTSADGGRRRARGGRMGARGEPELETLGVSEGDVDAGREALRPAAIAPLSKRIEELRANKEQRVALAARALAGSLAGLVPLADQLADDCAHEAIDAAALRRMAADNHSRELAALGQALTRGRFLREEALRHWQEYVGADDVTRTFSKGIGVLRGMLASLFRPSTAPTAEVREATTDDLIAVARVHAAEAARRTATAWSDEPAVARRVADDSSLWSPSAGFDERLRERIDAWVASIASDIAETGEGKRRLAKGASIGVNAIGVGVMLATFVHTAGLTGTEVGVAAATAFLNQKLLGALFGEAAMVELISRARARLSAALGASFGEERARFEALVPAAEELDALASDLRAAAAELRALPAAIGEEAEPVIDVAADVAAAEWPEPTPAR